MARVAVVLLLALAALAQASLPTAQEKAILRQHRVSLFEQKAKPLCKECEKIVMSLRKIVDNPQTEQELRDVMTKVCDLPVLGKFKEHCLDLINYVVVGIHELQSLLDDPTQVCDTLKLCASEAPGINTISKRMFLSVASKVVQDVRQPSPQMAIDTCGLCTSALNEIKQFLEMPQVVEKVESELEKVCKYFGKYQDKCKNFIDTDVANLLEIIVDALCQPEQTCAAMHLCKSTSIFSNLNQHPLTHPHLDRLVANITSVQARNGLDIGCMACKAGVGEAIKVLTRDSVESSLATDITDVVCKIMPESQKAGCYDFLNIYGKAALAVTFNEWTPEEICDAVHACSSKSMAQFESLSRADKSKVGCDVCKALSKTLAFELQQSNVQQDVINVLTKGCLLIPGKYANKAERCQTYVETYIPYMLDDIVALSYVPEMCTVLHMC